MEHTACTKKNKYSNEFLSICRGDKRSKNLMNQSTSRMWMLEPKRIPKAMAAKTKLRHVLRERAKPTKSQSLKISSGSPVTGSTGSTMGPTK